LNRHPLRDISDDDIAAYARDGAVCLRKAFDAGWVVSVADAFERARSAPGPEAVDHAAEEGAGRFVTDLFLWRRDEAVRCFVLESPAAEIAGRLMGGKTASFFFDTMWIKEPGVAKPTAWHQDQPYYPVDGQICAIWMPLDMVPREVALAFVRGSHLWGRWFDPTATTDGRRWLSEEWRFEPVPNIEGEPEKYDVISWALEPGDCVVFHGLMLHGASGNPQRERRRRALSTVWLGDDAVVSKRPPTRPRLADAKLVPGRPFEPELFPRVWAAN
jgi:ectoine hydroxylase-related dioxygenase (phytanoyl-CoA dioxygenase family)